MTGRYRTAPLIHDEALRRSLSRGRTEWRAGVLAVRFETRTAWIHLVLVLALIGLAVVALMLGDYGIGVGQVFAALFGRADDPLAGYFVTGVRAPRVVTAIGVGAALGTSGAIFQTLSGNPLGSPDVIGFTTGAATGALIEILVLGGGPVQIAVGAVIGGLACAALVYALSWRGGVAGFRLVLVGIGMAATLQALNRMLEVRAPVEAAQTAAQWLAGSLNATLWPQAGMLGAALAVLLPAAWLLHRPLGMLPYGDLIGIGAGVRVERNRLLLIVIGVGLVAVATAATGPIAFVALAAPHLTRRLTGTAGTALIGSALTGSLLVLLSDVIAQRALAPTQLAVGVVTGTIGGAYLVLLLALEWRRLRA